MQNCCCKNEFYFLKNNNFHSYGFAPSLALKQRLGLLGNGLQSVASKRVLVTKKHVLIG